MKGDLAGYIRKVDVMFDRAEARLENIAKTWMVYVVEDLLESTYGPGNQYDQTQYIATGRLRAGWQYGMAAPATASRMTGGPYDETGEETAARIATQIRQAPLPATAVVYNEVGYAILIHYGLEGHEHIGPRPWVDEVAKRSQDHFERAKADVGRG